MKWLERGVIVLVSLAIAIGVIDLLSGGLAGSHDDPGISATAVPGTAYRDLGDRRLSADELRPAYDSSPPTSGPHVPVAITRQFRQISDDQLLETLELGDVVLMYPGPTPPAELVAIARSAAPRFSAALASSGQAVILARRPDLSVATAVAWAHLLRGGSAAQIAAFTRYWLGRGAPGHAPSTVVGSN